MKKQFLLLMITICLHQFVMAQVTNNEFQQEVKLKDDIPYNPFKVTLEKVPDSTFHYFYIQKDKGREIHFTIKSKVKKLHTSQFNNLLTSGDVVLDGSYFFLEGNAFKENGNFINNMTVGKWKYFDKEGFLEKTITYNSLDNKKEFHEFFTPQGERIRTANFYGDKQNGEEVLYYPNGQIQIRRYYENGKLNGEMNVFYPDGSLHQSITVKNDMLEHVESWNKKGEKLPAPQDRPPLFQITWDTDSLWTMLKPSINSELTQYYHNPLVELELDKSGKINNVWVNEESKNDKKLEKELRAIWLNRKTGIHKNIAGEPFPAVIEFVLSDLIWLDTYDIKEDSALIYELNTGFTYEGWEFTNQKIWEQKYRLGLIATPHTIPDNDIFMVVEQMPSFPGGDEGLMNYLRNTVTYPRKAQEAGIEGRIYVSFVVDKTGKVCQPTVSRSIHPYIDAEAIRVVSQMPNWIPGKQRGEAVNVKYMLPVNFVLQDDFRKSSKSFIPKAKENKLVDFELYDEEVLDRSEQLPEFIGGEKALQEFLEENVTLPREAWNKKIEGIVYVQFVVTRFGEVVNAKVLKSDNSLFNAEALRVMAYIPNWKPGTQNGKAVNVKYTIPIQFTLQ